MFKVWNWTNRNRVFVGVMTMAALFTAPGSTYALKILPKILPQDVWNPKLAPFAVTMFVFSLILKIMTEIYEAAKKHVVPNLRRGNFPRYFAGLGMVWPGRVSLEVWQPAYEDELARYFDFKPKSDLLILNLCFALRMTWIILATILISLTDWRLVFLARKKPE